MKRQLIASAAFLALVASPALAQISIPYTFSNLSGNVPASYLDSDFNALATKACAISGCTMTGPLNLPSNPTSALQAATKGYVDSVASVGGATAANGDCSSTYASQTLTLSCLTTGGTPFAASATTNALNASNISSGTLSASRLPALSGDITTPFGSAVTTLTTVNSNVGTFGSSTLAPVITVNAKGLVTAITTATITGGGSSMTPPCATGNNGVFPYICYDFAHSTYLGAALSTDTCAKNYLGATCTGTQVEETNFTPPTGNYMLVIDATYPSTGSTNFAFSNNPSGSGGAYPQAYSYPITFNSAVTARTGAVEIAAYWNGSTWSVSFAGDTPVSAGTSGFGTGAKTIDFGNINGSSDSLSTAFRSFRAYPGTFTSAQIQQAATQ